MTKKRPVKHTYHVTFDATVEYTYSIEAASEDEAVSEARQSGLLIDENIVRFDLERVEANSPASLTTNGEG